MAQDRPAALVTGSASGIGRAAALRLAQAGYDVAINYSRSQDAAGQTLAELEKLGGQHLAVRADVSDDAAVVSLTRTLSRVLAPEVRVNAVAPGWIAGEWMQRTLGENYDRLMERRATWTPMQRNVTEDDVAETIFSLITSNPFVTGETIVIDGGYTATT
jgi:NAD(P)-dependent dehydrogenase (short-subunit alcohol dehydrogenase family)